MITFKVKSELYVRTDCVIKNINAVIKSGFAPCGDGCDYQLSAAEMEQLKMIKQGKLKESDFNPTIKGRPFLTFRIDGSSMYPTTDLIKKLAHERFKDHVKVRLVTTGQFRGTVEVFIVRGNSEEGDIIKFFRSIASHLTF